MRKFQILLTVLLLVLSGCAGGSRLDSSGVQVAWLESTRPTEPPPTILVGRNPPYGRVIAFWALAEFLRDNPDSYRHLAGPPGPHAA